MTRQEKDQIPSICKTSYNLFQMMETQNRPESIILSTTLSKEALRHTKLKYDSFGLEIVQTANNILHPGDKVYSCLLLDCIRLHFPPLLLA